MFLQLLAEFLDPFTGFLSVSFLTMTFIQIFASGSDSEVRKGIPLFLRKVVGTFLMLFYFEIHVKFEFFLLFAVQYILFYIIKCSYFLQQQFHVFQWNEIRKGKINSKVILFSLLLEFRNVSKVQTNNHQFFLFYSSVQCLKVPQGGCVTNVATPSSFLKCKEAFTRRDDLVSNSINQLTN